MAASPAFDPEQDKKLRQAEMEAAKEENEKLLAFQETQEKLGIQRETIDSLAELKDALEK